MVLCGLPVKKVWVYVKKFLSKYTDEMPEEEREEDTAAEPEEDTEAELLEKG